MITDFLAVGFLVVMEGLLSFDNALALAAMVAPLPENLRKKALTYGMAGAFAFRMLALCFVTYLMEATWVKYAGGGYLLYLSLCHFYKRPEPEASPQTFYGLKFWKIVISVELMDIAFSIDSILAAVAFSSKLWVVITGGILGIILMRFAATVFVGLIQKFPNLERSAYLLIAVVGIKLLLEGVSSTWGLGVDFEHIENVSFWWFWTSMVFGLATGFIGRSNASKDGAERSASAG